jgi:transposase-like protein
MTPIRLIRQNAIHAQTTQFDKRLQMSPLQSEDIIQFCVRWYVTYKLSCPDLVEMMKKRRMTLAPTTVLRWVAHIVLQEINLP